MIRRVSLRLLRPPFFLHIFLHSSILPDTDGKPGDRLFYGERRFVVRVLVFSPPCGYNGCKGAKTMSYYVYIISCTGGSFYTGVAADWQRRLREHRERSPKAARYTKSHPMEALRALWEVADKGAALRLEYRIKQLTSEEKRRLISRPESCDRILAGSQPVPAGEWGSFSPEPDPNT